MDSILAIAGYTIKQHIRHRVYLVVVLFGFILIVGSLVVSSLSIDRARVVLDMGLAGIEILALITIIFTTVNLLLEEMESRTVYLMLTHPLKRWEYLLGRYMGAVVSVAIAMLIMMAIHLAALFIVGWSWQSSYLVAWLCSLGKVVVMSSVALLFSLFSTSAASSMSFTLLVWVLGHFSEELKYLGKKSGTALINAISSAIFYITPNFSYFNYKDFYAAAQTPPFSWFLWLVIYTVSYTAICLFLSNLLFSRKEF